MLLLVSITIETIDMRRREVKVLETLLCVAPQGPLGKSVYLYKELVRAILSCLSCIVCLDQINLESFVEKNYNMLY